MDAGLIFDEKLEKDSLTACKKCYHILVRKPTFKQIPKNGRPGLNLHVSAKGSEIRT